ncbi:hypothetical protein AB3X91_41085 [Paraburkholderia sp. BR14263]|uniref:hypothetical protein n=1 Tax=unclassified Paraburkholderia TaxID=2615204 RepID=UPI0034CDE8F0
MDRLANPAPETEPDRDVTARTSRLAEVIFVRDLNEVHLLLDYVSGRPDVHIWDMGDIKIPGPAGADCTLTAHQTIERICELRYPPPSAEDKRVKAYNAALLLCVKD